MERLGSANGSEVAPIPADPAHDNSAGDPSQLLSPVAIASLSDARSITAQLTAQRDNVGNLQVAVWDVDESGSVSQKDQITTDIISAIALCAVSTNRAVSASRDSLGNLELIVWDIDRAGQLTRRGTGRAGEITAVAVCAVSAERVVAAMRNGSGNLELISWDIDAGGNIQRRGTGEAGGIWAVGLTSISDSRIVAIMQNLSLNLELIVWDIDANGEFQRRGEGDAGTVSAVAIATLLPDKDNLVVSAMRNGSLDLELILWAVKENGDLKRQATAFAGVGDRFTGERSNISVVAIQARHPAAGAPGPFVSAARNSSGNLEVTEWFYFPDGSEVSRGDTITGESISAVAISGADPTRNHRFATAVRDGQGNLEVIEWLAKL
jgi:hypothetical protein